ncbi:MAG: O-antigen ligase family protein [candidate division KSB1 bacterium]|nr:O-antigen ligase family protein [candidate division KSB1 bacterium]MDZ7276152.1 O-antigen ligase family protein [candidate division KSB1 bacterium]MDZ7287068.1 O-antigen ligase family protein [candidate division KSB1 bacterium]MDZ7297007.1 O-antigen ligase family protein [candidate division KSB1 bacterium]MDZ7307513.1 O-antigen ligase family protein [candidate division KSB1 bacterium]
MHAHLPALKTLTALAAFLTGLGLVAYFASHELLLLLVLGSIAVLSGLYLFRSPQAATLLFTFVFYSNIAVLAYQFHGVPQPVAAAVPLLLTLPLARYLFVQREGLIVDGVLGLMLLYLLTLILASFTCKDIFVALNEIGNYAIEGIVLYFLVLNAVRRLPDLRRVLWTLLLVGSFLGSLSLVQELTHSYDNNFFGLAQRKKTIDFDNLDYDVYSGAKRAEGPVGEQNRYAQIMVVLLPLALYLFYVERTRRRLLALAAAGLILSGVLLTFSRATFLTLVVLFLLLVPLKYIRPGHALAAGLALAAIVALALPDYIARVKGLVNITNLQARDAKTRELDGSLRGRYAQNLAALHVFVDHPLTGVGPGHFAKFYVRKYGNEVGTKLLRGNRRAHNMYLEMAAENGVFGLSAFLAIVLFMQVQLWRARRHWLPHRPELAHLATAFFLSIIAYLGTAVFLHLSYQRYYWFLLALAGVVLQLLKNEARAAQPAGATPHPLPVAA